MLFVFGKQMKAFLRCYWINFTQSPYRRRYRAALSDAFDIYLAIRRIIDQRVAKALGRDTPDYRVLHACPSCNYEVSVMYLITRL